MAASAIYRGTVVHRRLTPVPHRFRFRTAQLYLDLAELPELFDRHWLWSARRPAPAWFRRADYLGAPAEALDASVRALVESRGFPRPGGPIRLLTHLRYFGYVQNPVSFYYCFGADGTRLECIVAEVTNTPWGERHAYVVRAGDAGVHTFEGPKALHVSPFWPMAQTYAWRFSDPGERLSVRMENRSAGERVFAASLRLERRPLDGAGLASLLATFPLHTLHVVGAIYWQALRLRLKGAPFHPHPRRTANVHPVPTR